MGRKYSITKKAYKKAVIGTGGILTAVAKNLKVERPTLYKFLDRNPELRSLMDDERDKIVDMAEGALFQNVKRSQEKSKDGLLSSQDGWSVKYVLSTLGKSRGYVEKSEVSVDGGINGFVNIDLDEWERLDKEASMRRQG